MIKYIQFAQDLTQRIKLEIVNLNAFSLFSRLVRDSFNKYKKGEET